MPFIIRFLKGDIMILPILLNKTKMLPFYVNGIGLKEQQQDICRPNGLPVYQILYCTEGCGTFTAGGHTYKIKEGDAFFFRPNVPHEYHPVSKEWKTKWISFSGNSVESVTDYIGIGDTAVFSLHSVQDFDVLTNSLSDMFWCDDPDKEIKTSCMMYKIMVKIGECYNNAPQPGGMTQNEKFEKISPVIELMKTHYAEDLSLDGMAESIGVTANHLCRLFNQVYDTTPLKYLTHLRLNMAKYYLCSHRTVKIKEVATNVGFNDASYFCAVFKKAEGMTPDEYRKINAF